MLDLWMEKLRRVGSSVVCLVLAAVFIWRAYSFADPRGPSVMTSAMCIILGLCLVLTALAMVFAVGSPSNESD